MASSTNPPRSLEGYTWDTQTAQLTSGLPTAAAKTDSASTYPFTYDAIIIGAGFAGLVAARDLSVAGNKVLLLEARDRIGGRTWTAQGLNHSYEMGGGWVHWLQPHVWSEITRAGLTSLPSSETFSKDEIITMSGGPQYPLPTKLTAEDSFARLGPLITAFYDVDGAGGRTVFPNPHRIFDNFDTVKKFDISIADRLKQMDIPEADKEFLVMWLNCQGVTAPEKAGFLGILRFYSLANYDHNTMLELSGKFKIPGGTTALASSIYAEFRGVALFQRQVTSIVTRSDSAIVMTKTGESFTADQVICTVPLNCLGGVKFEPALPPSFSVKHINKGGKVLLHTKPTNFDWFGIGSPSSSAVFGFTESKSMVGGVNVVLFLGSEGYLEKFPLEADPQKFIDTLQSDMVPEDVRFQFTDMTWHDWRRDPFAQGLWAFLGAGGLTRGVHDIMKGRKVSQRVTLASADIAEGWIGYMDGAIEQGRRAAFEVSSTIQNRSQI